MSQCTLVLMTLDLGHLREYIYFASKGVVQQMPIAKEWLAALQSLMIFFATVWRFYTNEVRSTRNAKGGYDSPRLATIIFGCGSFLISCVLFVIICWGLLAGIPSSEDQVSANLPAHLKADIICLQTLTLVWVGYPIISIVSRIGHWGRAGDYYSASWSVFKDIAYASLDITSKAGLAIFFVLKASWIDGAEENLLVAEGKSIVNNVPLYHE